MYRREQLIFATFIRQYRKLLYRLGKMHKCLEEYSEPTDNNNPPIRRKVGEGECFRHSLTLQPGLTTEAKSVIENQVQDVSVKYMKLLTVCYQQQEFHNDYMKLMENLKQYSTLEFTDWDGRNPKLLWFPDYREKMKKHTTKVRVLQEALTGYEKGKIMDLGGYLAASCYHIGDGATIDKTYEKIFAWTKTHGYKCKETSMERCVSSNWTGSSEECVIEVLIEIRKE